MIRSREIVPLYNPIESTNSFSLDKITLLVFFDTNFAAKGIFSLVEFYPETKNSITSLYTKTIDGNSFPNDTKINIKLILDREVINSLTLTEESFPS